MGSKYYRDLCRILLANGCTFVRQGKGDHEIWFSPITNLRFIVDAGTKKKVYGERRVETGWDRPRILSCAKGAADRLSSTEVSRYSARQGEAACSAKGGPRGL